MTDRPPPGSATDNVDVAHEESDVNVRAIFGVALGLAITALLVHGVTYVMFNYFERREAARVEREYPLAIPDVQFPREPRIQPRPAEDLRAIRAREDALLSSYGWVDEKAGVTRITIDRAMQLLVERGLPARKTEAPPK